MVHCPRGTPGAPGAGSALKPSLEEPLLPRWGQRSLQGLSRLFYKASQGMWHKCRPEVLNRHNRRLWAIWGETGQNNSLVLLQADVIDNTSYMMIMHLVLEKLLSCLSQKTICTSKCFCFKKKIRTMEWKCKCRQWKCIMKKGVLGEFFFYVFPLRMHYYLCWHFSTPTIWSPIRMHFYSRKL